MQTNISGKPAIVDTVCLEAPTITIPKEINEDDHPDHPVPATRFLPVIQCKLVKDDTMKADDEIVV